MLELHDVRAGYGPLQVLHGISVEVAPGSVVAIIGSNGAGKSTTLKTISGLVRCRGGEVLVDGKRISSSPAEQVVRAGVAHVPEGRQVFANMTVRENLLLGAYARSQQAASRLEAVLGVLPELAERLSSYAGSLSGGQQQMLAIGRGLMSDPTYLLLDEPSLGLAPLVVARVFDVVAELARSGKGVLLVEQNGRQALALAEHAYLLERGRITMSGPGREMLANPEVLERYLGGGAASTAAERQAAWTATLASALAEG